MSVVYKFRQACIFRDFSESGATLEDLARAWASIERNRDEFDAEKDEPASEADHYLGYLIEVEEFYNEQLSMPPNEKASTSPQFCLNTPSLFGSGSTISALASRPTNFGPHPSGG